MQICAVGTTPGSEREKGKTAEDSIGRMVKYGSKCFLQRTRVPPVAWLFWKDRRGSEISAVLRWKQYSCSTYARYCLTFVLNTRGSEINTRSGRCSRSSSVNINSCDLSPSMFQEKIFNLTVEKASVTTTDLSIPGSLN